MGQILSNHEKHISKLTLVMGGARSGKSSFAERCGLLYPRVLYFATARHKGEDGEMEERIAVHRARRPSHWMTLEPPAGLAELVKVCNKEMPDAVIFDCATLWLGWEMSQSYKLYSKKQLQAHLESEIGNFVETLKGLSCSVFVVSNETGCGVVPEHQSGRMFRDLQGALNGRLAAAAALTCQCVAGIPLLLRDSFSKTIPFVIAAVDEHWVVNRLG